MFELTEFGKNFLSSQRPDPSAPGSRTFKAISEQGMAFSFPTIGTGLDYNALKSLSTTGSPILNFKGIFSSYSISEESFPALQSQLIDTILPAIIKFRLTQHDFFGFIVVYAQLREDEKLFGSAGFNVHFSGLARPDGQVFQHLTVS